MAMLYSFGEGSTCRLLKSWVVCMKTMSSTGLQQLWDSVFAKVGIEFFTPKRVCFEQFFLKKNMDIKASWMPVGFISEVNKTQQSEKKSWSFHVFLGGFSSTYYTFWFLGEINLGAHWDLDDFAFHYIKYGGAPQGLQNYTKADPNETSSLKKNYRWSEMSLRRS